MKRIRIITSSWVILALIAILFGPPLRVVNAATLTSMSDTMSRLADSSPSDLLSDHAIQFTTPTGVASTQTIVVTFPADFDGLNDPQGALDFNDVDLLEDTTPDTTCDGTAETLVASAPAVGEWSAVFSGTENRILTFTSGGASAIIAAASQVCVKIGENATGGSANSQYINPTTTGAKTITLSVGSGADTGNIIVQIIGDDQVAVAATVSATISFAVTDNAIGFGTLLTSAARWASGDSLGSGTEASAHNITAGTNSTSGYSITVTGNTLTSGGDTVLAIGASATDVTAGTGSEQYGLRMTASGGSGAVSAPYNGAANNYALDTVAFPDQVASSSGASATTTYAAFYAANIATNTEAGSYTSTLTYIAIGNF